MTTTTTISSDRRWELLTHRNFLLLFCAYGISAMGDHLSEMALLKTQNALGDDVDITPLDARMTFLFFAPFFLLAPLAGWLADRLPRRGVMIAADAARCLLMLFFIRIMTWTNDWGAWGPFLPLTLVGLFAALFSPARSALLPTLIRPDQLVRANGLISGLGVIATMFAIKIGGYLADYYEPQRAFRLDALTYLASAGLLLMLRPPRQSTITASAAGTGQMLRELADGVRYVRGHRRILELLAIAALVWFCGPLVKCVIPAVVRDVYGGTYQDISNYRLYLGLGLVGGAIIISTLGDALRSEIAVTWGLLGIASSILLFSLSTVLPLAPDPLARIGAIAVVGAGLFGVAVMASFNALLQRMTPDRYRGRIFGLKDLICTAALLLATGFLGLPREARVDRWVGYILLGVALLTFVAGFITMAVRLRRSPHGFPLMFMLHLNEFVSRFWWRLKRIGPSTVPHTGPVIVTANHACPADPLFLLASASYRPFAFMVAAEYTNWPVIRSIMRLIDCIPVRRQSRDTGATRQALEHLRAGKALGIFIEGRIVAPGESAAPKDGVAMLALKTGAKVIPAHIDGTIYSEGVWGGMLHRHRVRVRFGPPVDLDAFRGEKPDRETIRQATQRIFAAVTKLAPPVETSKCRNKPSRSDHLSEPRA